MNEETAIAALKYCKEQAVQCQLTYDGRGSFTIDLQAEIHAKVLWRELRTDGKQVNMLERPFFYRLS